MTLLETLVAVTLCSALLFLFALLLFGLALALNAPLSVAFAFAIVGPVLLWIDGELLVRRVTRKWRGYYKTIGRKL